MLIVLEGPDGAGKTTLKETYEKTYNDNPYYKYDVFSWHNGPYETPDLANKAFSDQLSEIERNSENQRKVFILDRTFMSERIYSEIFREDKIDDERYWALDKRLCALQPRIILCLPHMEVSLRNWQENHHDEMFSGIEQYVRVYQSYENFRNYTKAPFIKYDYKRRITNGT